MKCERWARLWTITFATTLGALSSIAHATSSPRAEAVFQSWRNFAIEHSLELRLAAAKAQQAGAGLYTAWTHLLPRLDANATESWSRDYSFVTSGQLSSSASTLFAPTTQHTRGWKLTASAPLFNRSRWIGLDTAQAERDQAKLNAELTLSEFDYRLRDQLAKLVLEAYRERTLETSIKIAQTNLKEAKLRFELGQKTKIDVLRSQANLAQLESSQITVSQAREEAQNQLLVFSGIQNPQEERSLFETTGLKALLDQEESLLIQEIETLTQVDAPVAKISLWLNLNEPGLDRQLAPALESSDARLKLARARADLASRQAQSLLLEAWPELSVQASLGKQGPNWQSTWEPSSRSHSIAISLSIPLFSFGSNVSQYLEKVRAQEQAQIQFEQTALDTKNQVRLGLRRVKALQKQLEAQQFAREQNAEIMRLSTKSYELGRTTLLELLSAQDEWIRSKTSFAQSRVDFANLVRQLDLRLANQTPSSTEGDRLP
jgi:outer membrane protein TolC